jgi:2-iminobutanoate/2-iminopropanoate deaminase
MTGKQVVDIPGAKPLGPYSQAVRAGGLLFVAGQPGTDPATGLVVGGSFEMQAEQVFRNLDIVLRAGGSRLDLVVNTTVLVSDMDSFPIVNRLFAQFFPKDPPARMTMQVVLPRGLLISIGCVAVIAE